MPATTSKRNRVICIFPGCNRSLTTYRFKSHFEKKHLEEGEQYSTRHRDQFERALGDPNLVDGDGGAGPAFFSAAFERLEQRLVTCETLLRALVPNAAQVLAPQQRAQRSPPASPSQSDGSAAPSSSSSDEEETPPTPPAPRRRKRVVEEVEEVGDEQAEAQPARTRRREAPTVEERFAREMRRLA